MSGTTLSAGSPAAPKITEEGFGRFTKEEMVLLKQMFEKNDKALKLLRKIFLPEIDMTVPLGQQIDLYMTLDIRGMTPEMAYVNLLARNTLVTHLEQQLIQINSLVNIKEETPEERRERLKKDSNK